MRGQGTGALHQGSCSFGVTHGPACGIALPVQHAGANHLHQVVAGAQQRQQGGVFGVQACGQGLLAVSFERGQLEHAGNLAHLGHRPAGDEPAQRAPKVQHRLYGGQLLARLGGQLLGELHLGNVHVCELCHLGDVACGLGQAVKLALQQQRAQALQAFLHRGQLLAVQAVAHAQVVVQKAQGRAHGKGVQPERGFGQLHRHGVFVHAEDGFFQNHAAHDVPVV